MKTNKCKLVGILNVTPDSFSDGGKYNVPEKAVRRAKQMVKEGVDIIDIGGESTAPDSKNVSVVEELNRVIPVLEALNKVNIGVPIAVDTYKAEVAKQCLKRGVEMVNDVTALRGDPEMMEVLGYFKPQLVLMYSKDSSSRITADQFNKSSDIIYTIKKFLIEQVQLAIRYGMPKDKIILDPGLGAFLSSVNDPVPSFEVINRLDEIKKLGHSVYISPSYKSFLGGELKNRKFRTLAVSSVCVYNKCDYLRVHDVKEHRDLIDVLFKFF